MTVSTDAPFADVVRRHTARSHDLDWPAPAADGSESAYCIYCGALARDRRPVGLPWVDMNAGGPEAPSLILACEGPTIYAEDGTRFRD